MRGVDRIALIVRITRCSGRLLDIVVVEKTRLKVGRYGCLEKYATRWYAPLDGGLRYRYFPLLSREITEFVAYFGDIY